MKYSKNKSMQQLIILRLQQYLYSKVKIIIYKIYWRYNQMADKKSPAEGWPVISGDYIVGDPESPVAVTTLASHIEADLTGAAIAGPCKTENLGIEKVVANIISNPNIRFLILAGAEVQGHITGQSFKALHANGADPDKKKIIEATGAIPFVENVPLDGIERFQQQLEIVDLIDTEDIGAIQSKINECVEKDPGALESEPIVMEVDEENKKLVIVPNKKEKEDDKN